MHSGTSRVATARLAHAIALALGVVGSGAAVGQSESATSDPSVAGAELTEVVVTGFRQSLDVALDVKRSSVASVDAIVAEDIAKFPDQNLAESLQRVPGIAILRDGGEGRAISVRGLGPQFTRVRVNGMETVATSTDGAAANRDRAFDFNVFASELFNSIIVHKTASPSLDEGSLGAVVDLNTGNALAGKPGLTLVGSAQGQLNSLSDDWGPRLAGLASWRNDEGTFGASVSAAFTGINTLELGNNTVRWQQARFDSVNGTPCFTAANTGGTYVPSAGCDSAALAFHPRIPRYGEVAHDRKRLGVTAGVQWHPLERTRLSLDALYSKFSEDREEKWGEVLFRGLERQVDVTSFEVDGDNNLIRGTFNDVPVRTEHYLRESETAFHQVGLTLDQDFSDTVRLHVLGGVSKSDADIPVETTITFDDRNGQNYAYDYRNMERPVLAFGTSVSDPANFQLSEIRDRPSNVTNKFRTASAALEWDALEAMQVKVGGVYRRFNFQSVAFTRDTVICPGPGADRVLGTVTCSARTDISDTAVYGYQVTPTLAETYQLADAGAPGGTTTSWLIPNLAASTAFTGLYGLTPRLDSGNNRSVVEKVTGGFAELNGSIPLGAMELRYNGGVRHVKTDQTSSGINSGTFVTVNRTYNDTLPSLNLALNVTPDLVVRLAASKVITRPTLGNLTPGGTVDGFNFRVNFGNPQLDPFRAKAYDLAVEWYFAEQAVFSVAVFKKDVESFPVSATRSGTFASTGLPVAVIPPSSPAAADPEAQPWAITSITNGAGANLKGAEISLQAPFSFLPGWWSGFGGIANATFIDSAASYRIAGPAVVPGGPLVSVQREQTLLGVSKRAYNGTLYYENARFSARVSGSYRGPFVDGLSATGNFFEGYKESFNLDASFRYRFSDSLELSLEGVNLTDDYRSRFTDEDSERNYEYNHFGRSYLVGARYKFGQ